MVLLAAGVLRFAIYLHVENPLLVMGCSDKKVGILGMEESLDVFIKVKTWVTLSFCLKEDKRKSISLRVCVCVCVSLEYGQILLIIYQEAHDILCI